MVDRAYFHVGFPSPSIASVSMADWPALARHCEESGFDCMWHSNERFYREMWVRMTTSIMVTDRMSIGGAIAEPFAVHPALTAQALATAAEVSDGRATVAMGAGGSGFPMMGVTRRRPAAALREALIVMRGLLDGEQVNLEGEVVTARGARLHFRPPSRVPLWIASRGDRILEVGGECADGIMIATYADPTDVGDVLPIVKRGAARSNRQLSDIRVMSRVDTCVHEDERVAFDGSRMMVAKLLWASYPDRRFVERVGLKIPIELENVIATRDYDALHSVSHLVPDEFVAKFCWAGTPEGVAARVARVMDETGLSEVGFWILRAEDQTLHQSVSLVADGVIPKVRQLLERRNL